MDELRSGLRIRRRARARKTSKAVQIADRLAGLGIRLAGLGTIGAVLLVCVFLFSVAAPLFRSQRIERAAAVHADADGATRMGVDDYDSVGWAYLASGRVRAFDLASGATLDDLAPFEKAQPTAVALDPANGTAAFGFADGTVRLAKLTFASTFEDVDPAGAAAAAVPPGRRVPYRGGVAERVSEDQLRVVRFGADFADAFALGDPGAGASPVLLLDEATSPAGPALAGLTKDCRLWLRRVYTRTNMITGEEISETSGGSMKIDRCAHDGPPESLWLAGTGDNAYLLWPRGLLVRIDARDFRNPHVAEQVQILDDADATVTAAAFLPGRKTLVVGDSSGTVHTWFRVKPDGATTIDGALLVSSQRISGTGSPVTAIAPSSRSRMLAIGYGDGAIHVVHVTSGKNIGQASPGGEAVRTLALAPKEDALFVLSSDLTKWVITPGHPEITLSTLFGRVWYEGYATPAHVWQSSSGSNEFEPKLGLTPLVFGTLKATFYSLLFGAPLALLAAIYTSEFLHPRVKARVKPMIELMASLPSVVLGFLAAIVFAPLVEDVVPQLLTAVLAIPFLLLLAAHVAQTMPARFVSKLATWRLPLAAACLPLGVLSGFALGDTVERMLFAGNFKLWLDGRVGNGAGAWALLLLPAAAVAVALGGGRVAAVFSGRTMRTPVSPSVYLLLRFIVASAAVVALAFAAAAGLTALGLDPRGWLLGTYVQRNAMIVGFVMGFAIIPIIYTISEDALSSVPEHLRAGSLALGATRWQTAVRIVVPTAMSGLFSAMMIGLGRAVGETMIVLMAAGNTPVLEWNIFSGLRTLSANIAVELPEAVRDSTHYRTLFLAALVLFTMTFTINTVAEVVRLRFRRRAYQL